MLYQIKVKYVYPVDVPLFYNRVIKFWECYTDLWKDHVLGSISFQEFVVVSTVFAY